MPDTQPQWDKRKPLKTYNIRKWGLKYFDINNHGNVTAAPLREKGGQIEILEIVKEARQRGLRMPLLVRFQDLLRHRVQHVNESFRQSIAEAGYKGKYQG